MPYLTLAAASVVLALVRAEGGAPSPKGGPIPPPNGGPLDPEQTLVIDTTKGRVVVEMRPDFAPKSVERVKLLAREARL